MPLSGKPQGGHKALRPGITQSHRGRVIRNIVILVTCLAFGFMFISNALNPKEDAPTFEEEQQAELEAENEVNKLPDVQAAPANPFQVRRAAKLPDTFKDSPAYQSLISTAEGTAAQLSTYSSKQTPEAYVDSVENISDDLERELLASSEKMWPSITKKDISVTSKPEGTDPVVRSFNEESSLASVEVVIQQTITLPDGTTESQTRAYVMDLSGKKEGTDDMAWTVGGFAKQ